MKKKESSVISASIIMCLAFTGLSKGAENEKCRKLPCDRANFDDNIYKKCILSFNQTMASTDYQLKCPWPSTRRYYINLIMCIESWANLTCCTDASFSHKIFLEIHQIYFFMCSYWKDPGLHILVLLILPCPIITLMIPLLWQYFKLHEYELPKEDH